MSSAQAIVIVSDITAGLNLTIIVASMILNPLILLVCIMSKKLRSHSTFKLFAVNSVNDLFTSVAWNFESFMDSVFNFNVPFRSLVYCKFVSVFLQFSSIWLTSWLLVLISLDRLLSLTLKNWSRKHFIGNRPVICILVVWVVILGINLDTLFTVGYSFVINGTEIIICYESSGQFNWFQVMNKILVYGGELVPMCLLLILNIVIIYKATRFDRVQRLNAESITISRPTSASTKRRKMEMTRSILLITFLYIALVFPSTVIQTYFYTPILGLAYGRIIINLLYFFQFSYSGFNFIILFFTNKLFAQQVKVIIFRQDKDKKTVSTRNNQNTS